MVNRGWRPRLRCTTARFTRPRSMVWEISRGKVDDRLGHPVNWLSGPLPFQDVIVCFAFAPLLHKLRPPTRSGSLQPTHSLPLALSSSLSLPTIFYALQTDTLHSTCPSHYLHLSTMKSTILLHFIGGAAVALASIAAPAVNRDVAHETLSSHTPEVTAVSAATETEDCSVTTTILTTVTVTLTEHMTHPVPVRRAGPSISMLLAPSTINHESAHQLFLDSHV